jgi:hypothetical protein
MRATVISVLLVSSIAAHAANSATPVIWTLNLHKSQLLPPDTEATSYTLKREEISPGAFRLTFDIRYKDGHQQHIERTRTYDGQEHIGQGLPAGTSEVCWKADPQTLRCTGKTNGKIVYELTTTESTGSKTLVHTIHTPDSPAIQERMVFERQ